MDNRVTTATTRQQVLKGLYQGAKLTLEGP